MTTPTSHPFSWQSFVEPASAAVSVATIFPGLLKKSAIQTGNAQAPATFKGCIQAGAIVGTQVLAERHIKKEVKHRLGLDAHPLTVSLTSSGIVGAVSTIPLGVLNGMSLGQTPMSALRSLNLKKAAVINGREIPFLCSLSVSQPVAARAQEHFGDTLAVRTASDFGVGVLGSISGHPADTYLTRLQSGSPVDFAKEGIVRPLMRGWKTRAGTVGVCCALMNRIAEGVNETLED